jgi:hypothetical protein
MKHALLVLQTNPFHTDFLFFPQGSDLHLHALTPHGYPVPYTTAAEVEGMDTYLRDVVGLVPIFNDSSLTVYRNPQIE